MREATGFSGGEIRDGACKVKHGALWYRVYPGPTEATPLVILHGGPGCPSDYLFPLSKLADERTVIFYDQLGCGRSTQDVPAEALTVEQFAQDLQTLIEHLELEKFALLGHSFGGLLALAHQDLAAARAERLILASPLVSTSDWIHDAQELVSALPQPEHQALQGPADTPEYQAAEGAFYARHFCRLDPWPPELQQTMDNLAQQVYQTMWGPNEFTQSGNLTGEDKTGVLRNLEIPVLFTCGREDESRPQTLARYQALCQDGHLSVLENASHCAHLEHPEAYVSIVRTFLNGQVPE